MAAPYAGHVKVTVFVMVCLVMVCAFVPWQLALLREPGESETPGHHASCGHDSSKW